MANSEPEQTNADKLTKQLAIEFDSWYQNIPDTYGGQGVKKPFDGIFTMHGIAFEFKFQDKGIHFNLEIWRKDEPHQELGLWQFWNSGAGDGILLIFWKRKNGRIEKRWAFVKELLGKKKLKLEDMKDENALVKYLRSICG